VRSDDFKGHLKLSDSEQSKNRPGANRKSVFVGRRKLRRSCCGRKWHDFVKRRRQSGSARRSLFVERPMGKRAGARKLRHSEGMKRRSVCAVAQKPRRDRNARKSRGVFVGRLKLRRSSCGWKLHDFVKRRMQSGSARRSVFVERRRPRRNESSRRKRAGARKLRHNEGMRKKSVCTVARRLRRSS
jgi:hypothetical protein